MAGSTISAREGIIRELFARLSAGNPDVAELYHENATIRRRMEPVVTGREAIRRFYLGVVADTSPDVEIVDFISDERRVAALLRATTTGGVQRRAVDVFEVDEDGIHSLEIYSDGQPLTPA
jgi:hypothetical protein